MERSFRSGLILLAGIALLAAAAASQAILFELSVVTAILGIAGLLLAAWGAYALRTEIGGMFLQGRGEIMLYTLGVIGVLVAVAYFSVRFPVRFDMTASRIYSLSEPTVQMLKRLEKPVHIVF
ncbi:MAG: hypothetical protein ABI728_06785, partial [Betaproteobacteria bacterium]